MDRFEKAMLDCGIPQDKINLFKLSPIWIKRFNRFTREEVDGMIYFFPKIYITLNVPINVPIVNGLKPATEAEFREAKKNYLPMDLSD